MKEWKDLIDWLDVRLTRIEAKQDDLSAKQVQMTGVLDEHQRRSLANEKAVAILKDQVKPLTVATAMWAVFAKVVALAGALVGLALGVMKLLGQL